MSEKKLTASLEDYLEIIYTKLEENSRVKAIEISKELKVSRASVTEALKKLEKEGLIIYGRYESIAITDAGILKAKEVINKHKILQEFFEQVLGLEENEATENACKIEHVISQNAFEQLHNFIEFCNDNKLVRKFNK